MDDARPSAPEIVRLLAAASRTRDPRRDTAILAVALDTGARRSDIVALRRCDFDATTGLLVVGSGLARRTIRLGSFARHAVAASQGAEPGSALIVSRAGDPVTPRVVHEQMLRIGELAESEEPLRCHVSRRAYVEWAASTYRLSVALRLAGHVDRRLRRATEADAIAAQMTPAWRSPIDTFLDAADLLSASAA